MEVKEKNEALGIKRAFEEAGWRPLRRRPSLPGGAQPLPWDKLRGRAPAAAKGPNPLGPTCAICYPTRLCHASRLTDNHPSSAADC